ncbi:MAG: SPOR domain-containing protein [Candidatus Omnitrophota bacterium]
MGFFSKKKNTDAPSSVLSETEIQKRLYGEFSDRISHAGTGEREHFKEPATVPFVPKESSLEKDAAFDLFSAQKEALADAGISSRSASPEQKSADSGSRYVPLHDFEKKPLPSDAVSSNVDPYARFRRQENRLAGSPDFLKGFLGKMGELFRFFSDPKQVALRRVLYWGAAALAVFFLFWGVNALNSQREEAMRVRYKIPGEAVPVKTPEVVATTPVNPVAERPVVIIPAPVRASKPVPSVASYVIQVVTYPTQQAADQIVDSFKREGLRAFVKESARPNGGVFYMVLIGGFHTAAEAQSQLLKFRTKEVARPFQDAFVRTNRS